MFSFCFPNRWPSCVRGDISFYTDSSIKPPCSLSPALPAFPHNSDLSNPVIWHFSWPACPLFKVRWCNSTYLKVEAGSLPNSLKKLQFGSPCELQRKVWASSTCWLTLEPLDPGAQGRGVAVFLDYALHWGLLKSCYGRIRPTLKKFMKEADAQICNMRSEHWLARQENSRDSLPFSYMGTTGHARTLCEEMAGLSAQLSVPRLNEFLFGCLRNANESAMFAVHKIHSCLWEYL